MRRSTRWRAFGTILGAVVVGLVVALGVDILRDGGLERWLAPGLHEPVSGPQYEARGRVLDVAGRGIYLDCRGSAGRTPTVVLEAGFGAGAESWGTVLDGIASFTRVCAWDRPGLGRSAPRPIHSAGQTTEDLRAVLNVAGEQGPFLVLAHSFGGVYARLFAARTDTDDPVVGLVMLDTYEPDLGMADDPALPEDLRAEIQRSLDGTAEMLAKGESLDWQATARRARGRRPGDGRRDHAVAGPKEPVRRSRSDARDRAAGVVGSQHHADLPERHGRERPWQRAFHPPRSAGRGPRSSARARHPIPDAVT